MAAFAFAVAFLASIVFGQNDFLGRKYSVINNLTTIDLKNSINVKYVLSPSLVKSPKNPLFGQDKPWEARIDNGYPNVVYTPDNGNKTWQLWYDNFITTSPHLEGELYAQSSDGINWIKPNLGLIEFNGSTANNIVLAPTGGLGIFKDIYTKNESERYKAFGYFEKNGGGTAVSSDGLHWNGYRAMKLNNRWDTHNNMFYDLGYPNVVDKYFAVTRGPDFPPRTVAVSKSNVNDFDGSFTEALVVLSGGNDNQTYAQVTFEYYNIFLGLVMLFDSTSSDERVYCELSWSPNMYDWYRVLPGEQLIPLSTLKPVTYDSYICFAAAYPAVVDDVIRLYYFGGDGPHGGERTSYFSLATIRMDGFAGIRNVEGVPGIVNTFKLVVDGKYFCVSVDIDSSSVNGSFKAGMIGVNGYDVEDAYAITQNVTDFTVKWKNGNDLSALMGKMVEIEFELDNAILYTPRERHYAPFWVSDLYNSYNSLWYVKSCEICTVDVVIIVLFWCVVVSSIKDPQPPVWPDAFSIGSREHLYALVNNSKIPISDNEAFWYYDYPNKRMRFDHMQGQVDNFCWINVRRPIECQLIFDPSGVMFVNYPTEDFCCTLCTSKSIGCTVLKPDWLLNSSYNGTKTFNDGRTCNVWTEAGFVAQDYWSQDDSAVPCAYFEDIEGTYWHELDFNASSYVVGEPNANIFDVPSNCHTICNNTYPPTL